MAQTQPGVGKDEIIGDNKLTKARSQGKSWGVDKLDTFGNSCALETQPRLAALDRNLVRAALRSRAQ